MWRSISVLLCLISLAASARHPSLPPFLLGRPTNRGFFGHGEHVAGLENVRFESTNFTKSTIQQQQNHFDASNSITFSQRYWYNPTFTQNKNIVFLLIQGESPATDKWVSNPNYQYLQWAKEFGADVFQLEHRCFGLSRPLPDLDFQNLETCTMSQALEDIHNFIGQMNTLYKFNNPKWITFGGSYPGTLSALFRANYPQDTVGAVASSAPLQWTLDFFQYAQVVDSVLQQTDAKCHDNVQEAFRQMQQLSLSTDGMKTLNNAFQLDPPFTQNSYTQKDIDNFFANVYSFFQGVVQYTYDGRDNSTINGLNVKNLCNVMNDANTDIVSRVKNVIDWVNAFDGIAAGSFPNSYNDMMTALKNITYDDENGQSNAANRGWMWLCCNELGVLQTTDQGRNVFQQTVPLNYFVDMCSEMFGPTVDIKYIRDRNLQTLKKFGGNVNYGSNGPNTLTNIVLPNGSFDPWHILGTNTTNPTNHVTPLLIPGAAHCSDMYPVYGGEPSALAANRDIIHSELQYFLGVSPKSAA